MIIEQENKMTHEKWALELSKMTDDELRQACNKYIWLSAYANNNPDSAYHWQCDMTYDECHLREKIYIYAEEHEKLSKDH